MLNTWDTRFASCQAPEEEWSRSLPTNGDEVVCELARGVWLHGIVGSVPRVAQWQTLPRVGMPMPTAPEPSGTRSLEASVDPFLFQSRSRKKPQLYDASTTSTEYTRSLKKKATDDDERRRASLTVDFVDGVTRCVKLALESRGDAWVLARDWASHCQVLQASASIRCATSLAPAMRLLYRVDGLGWQRVCLERRINDAEQRQLCAMGCEVAGAPHACPPPAPPDDATACKGARCKGARCEAAPCEAVPRVRMDECAARGAPCDRLVSDPSWWRARVLGGGSRVRRRWLLLHLTGENQLASWAVPDDLESCWRALTRGTEEEAVAIDDKADDDAAAAEAEAAAAAAEAAAAAAAAEAAAEEEEGEGTGAERAVSARWSFEGGAAEAVEAAPSPGEPIDSVDFFESAMMQLSEQQSQQQSQQQLLQQGQQQGQQQSQQQQLDGVVEPLTPQPTSDQQATTNPLP